MPGHSKLSSFDHFSTLNPPGLAPTDSNSAPANLKWAPASPHLAPADAHLAPAVMNSAPAEPQSTPAEGHSAPAEGQLASRQRPWTPHSPPKTPERRLLAPRPWAPPRKGGRASAHGIGLPGKGISMVRTDRRAPPLRATPAVGRNADPRPAHWCPSISWCRVDRAGCCAGRRRRARHPGSSPAPGCKCGCSRSPR